MSKDALLVGIIRSFQTSNLFLRNSFVEYFSELEISDIVNELRDNWPIESAGVLEISSFSFGDDCQQLQFCFDKPEVIRTKDCTLFHSYQSSTKNSWCVEPSRRNFALCQR